MRLTPRPFFHPETLALAARNDHALAAARAVYAALRRTLTESRRRRSLLATGRGGGRPVEGD